MDMRRLVGENFARLRKARGLTQEQVADRSGFSQQYLSGLEKGHRNPTVITLFELASCLETTPDEFLRDIKPDTQTENHSCLA
ncbi:helix-turn-helix transcriptional regulator [Acetobacter thailandicus]|uniref:helix-turn-helix domain-containing protein n=1 Tax=Acetobacter thailandicus TaxID=1502842 RepID=UPI001BAE02B9|nr:helix-turn-helix transcriptional regulator [Acetobacter thailandicus]MBS0986858.1 helix-turn-helix transcriptional regulator [Acetobacter thailandicus]